MKIGETYLAFDSFFESDSTGPVSMLLFVDILMLVNEVVVVMD